jgi:predicted ATP-dependent endonuclease of OLD family
MYEKVCIENFRGVRKLEITDFKQFNLIVGKNNSGKTSLLEALFLLSAPTNPEIAYRLNNFRGFVNVGDTFWQSYNYNLDAKQSVRLVAELGQQHRRTIIIRPTTTNSTEYQKSIKNIENLASFSLVDNSPSYKGLSYEVELTVPGENSQKIKSDMFLDDKGRDAVIVSDDHLLKAHTQAVFLHSGYYYNDLATRLSQIIINKQTDKIIKVLQHIEPSITTLSVAVDGLIYCDTGLKSLLPINILGGGILKVLAMILAIMTTPNGVVLMDEVDNGLHYSAQTILWEAIFTVAKEANVQIFATTHSIECVRAYELTFGRLYNNGGRDNMRLYRLENKKDAPIRVLDYDYEVLNASLESGWEMR